MSLASYDRLFPSQDTLPAGGVGNLIAAPLYGKARRDGATVFLDPATLEPHDDQWEYLSTLGRITPREAVSAARRAGQVTVGAAVDRVELAGSTKTRPTFPPVIHARLGDGIRLEQAELTPALLATLKHAASMPNPSTAARSSPRRAVACTSPCRRRTGGCLSCPSSFAELTSGGKGGTGESSSAARVCSSLKAAAAWSATWPDSAATPSSKPPDNRSPPMRNSMLSQDARRSSHSNARSTPGSTHHAY